MDNTTEAVTRLTDALDAAAPNSRVTVLCQDLRAVLQQFDMVNRALVMASEQNEQLEEQIAEIGEAQWKAVFGDE